MHSGADMAAELEFVNRGDILEYRSMFDIETILRIQIKDSIYHSQNGQETIKCEDKWHITNRGFIR